MYPFAAENVKRTGAQVADFIQQSLLQPRNIHCIGHSLGNHFNSPLKIFKKISNTIPNPFRSTCMWKRRPYCKKT